MVTAVESGRDWRNDSHATVALERANDREKKKLQFSLKKGHTRRHTCTVGDRKAKPRAKR